MRNFFGENSTLFSTDSEKFKYFHTNMWRIAQMNVGLLIFLWFRFCHYSYILWVRRLTVICKLQSQSSNDAYAWASWHEFVFQTVKYRESNILLLSSDDSLFYFLVDINEQTAKKGPDSRYLYEHNIILIIQVHKCIVIYDNNDSIVKSIRFFFWLCNLIMAVTPYSAWFLVK